MVFVSFWAIQKDIPGKGPYCFKTQGKFTNIFHLIEDLFGKTNQHSMRTLNPASNK